MNGRPPDPGSLSSTDVRVRTHNLVVSHRRRRIIDRVSVALARGIVAVVGPNGAGKSTFLRALATLVPIRAGHADVMGSQLTTRAGASRARTQLGFLPQRPSFLDHLTVAEALTYAAWLHRIPRSRRRDAVERTLQDLNLEAFGAIHLRTLSGGTRQRAHIGQAIIHQPPVLLVDEPTVGLDADQRLDFRRLLRRLAANRLVVMSTHLTEDIELLADRVIAFSAGRLVFDGTPEQLAQLGMDHALDRDARGIELGLHRLVRP